MSPRPRTPPEPGCTGPGIDGELYCGRPIYGNGFCEAHSRQRLRNPKSDLKPLRTTDPLVPLPQPRVKAEVAAKLAIEAAKRKTSVYALVSDLLSKASKRL